ncbi:hypothetical protein EV182_001482, partial [Spiromyces aspiralis]
PKTYEINAFKDSTILRTRYQCPTCPSSDCNQCTLGGESSLQVVSGDYTVKQAIIGFTLPSETIGRPDRLDKCVLQLPKLTSNVVDRVTLPIYAASSTFWDEYSVNANNAPSDTDYIGSVTIMSDGNPPPVDLTNACKLASAKGAGFSIIINPALGRSFEFPSKEAGKPSKLSVTIH